MYKAAQKTGSVVEFKKQTDEVLNPLDPWPVKKGKTQYHHPGHAAVFEAVPEQIWKTLTESWKS